MVKTPSFKLLANGVNVGLELEKDIKSISFKDEAGVDADRIIITVVNPKYKKPKKDDELTLFLGYDNDNFFKCGVFKVQGSKRINNKTLVIRATSTDFGTSIKELKSKTYSVTTIRDICLLKAKEYGFKLKCDFDINIKHLVQTNQSDLDFLSKLAIEYNGIFSIKNETLIFIKKGTENNLPIFKYDALVVANLNIDTTSKAEYLSCICKYHDNNKNKEVIVKVGEGEPILIFRGSFKDELEARIKAEARLEKMNGGIVRGSLSTTGQTVYAGAKMKLENTIHGEDDGEYSIVSVSHKVNERGWSVSLEFER